MNERDWFNHSSIDWASIGLTDSEMKSCVAEIKEGNVKTMDKLYREFFPRVLRYQLVHTHNIHDAEDLAQDTMVKILEAIPVFEDRGIPLAHWVLAIAHNIRIDASRRHRDVVNIFQEFKKPKVTEDLIDVRLSLLDTSAAINNLPPAQKEVMHLRFAAGLSIGEIAEVTGKSQNAVKVLQHKATAKLRQLLAA